ncbi:MAG: hypothetical protein IPJ51_20315 [Saprospiraceae bacterium]|nr:hypothetical protein [Saprospiraceae bacterium]
MTKQKTIDIWIDKLTNSIVNTISGDSLPTHVIEVTSQDLKIVTKSRGWNFNWKGEIKKEGTIVYKLVILGNENIIQGLISLEDRGDHVFVNIIENAPFNIGKNKVYEGVPGNLFAYACRLSWDNGNQGLVSFVSKSRLIDHYEKSLGAIHVGGFKMVIFPKPAFQLIKQYYPHLVN